ncbi:MAG: protein kinase [Pyrinomonadaceae bacterium]
MKTCPQCGESYEPRLKFCARDGAVLEDAPQELVGQQLDAQYESESFVARGGMGSIYRARHIILGDRVAIKVLRPEYRANPEWLRRFQREGQAARRFRHPNAVTVYDLRTSADGLVYMVMEFVEGVSLDKELKARGRFTPADALKVLEPVAQVLECAHEEGVVHRDLKPENVMIAHDDEGAPEIKLLDLGVAKLRDFAETGATNNTPLTIAGQVLGTPYYMSPEQWGETPRDGGADVDGRTDIYSLAVMFYELVAGRRPFTGRTLAEIRHAHVALQPAPLEQVAPDVTPAFARAVEHGLAKDRADRPQTAGAFVTELRGALDGQPKTGDAAPAVFVEEEEQAETPEAARAEPGAGAARASESGASHAPAAGASRDAFEKVAAGGQPSHDGEEATRTSISTGGAPPRQEPARASTDAPSPAPDAPASAAENQNGSSSSGSPSVTPSAAQSVAPPSFAQSAAPSVSRYAAPVASSSSSQVGASASSPRAGVVAARAGKKSRAWIALVVVALLFVVCAGVVATGWFVWSRWQASRRAMLGEPPTATTGVGSGAATTSAPAKVEALSYWIEAFESADAKEGERVARAGAISLASGQQFKFHFSPASRGYFYVVGPGGGNAPTTFLTAQPSGILKTNYAPAQSDFAYPYGAGQVLELDKNAGADEFTVIYSATPLLEPAFLAARPGHALSPAEQKQLEDLRARAQTAATTLDVQDTGAERAVTVNVPDREAARLVVFDIRIEHQ